MDTPAWENQLVELDCLIEWEAAGCAYFTAIGNTQAFAWAEQLMSLLRARRMLREIVGL